MVGVAKLNIALSVMYIGAPGNALKSMVVIFASEENTILNVNFSKSFVFRTWDRCQVRKQDGMVTRISKQ